MPYTIWRPAAQRLLIMALWAWASLPWVSLRSFIHEEGTNAVLARDILARGHALAPALFGVPWLEKPSLLPWLIAAISRASGGVDEWSARLAPMLAVLATALLVNGLTRRYASAPAALFAALAFMFCPLMMTRLSLAEPDTLIIFLSFAAFRVWWAGAAAGRVSLLRWLACGSVLAMLAMAKGPQPCAFFALGVGAETLRRRRWQDLPGLLLCFAAPALATAAWAAAVYRPGGEAAWVRYMRVDAKPDWPRNLAAFATLAVELLPALLLAPLAPTPQKREDDPKLTAVAAPLILYSCLATAVLLLWPGAASRYATPIAPAVAVLAGLAWDGAAHGWRRRVRRAAAVILGGLVVAQLLVATLAPPLFAARYSRSRTVGRTIEAAILADPAPFYCTISDDNHPHTNELFYVSAPIRWLPPSALRSLAAPAWLEGSAGDIALVLRERPDLRRARLVTTPYHPKVVATRLEAARRP